MKFVIVLLALVFVVLLQQFVKANQFSKHDLMSSGKAPNEIDFVITWVNGQDPAWKEIKQSFSHLDSKANNALQVERFGDDQRDPEADLKRCVISILHFASWARTLILVTMRPQSPDFIERLPPEHRRKIRIVYHDEIIDAADLPVFNSHAIESALHSIPGLSEHFIYANDDLFFANYAVPADFYCENTALQDVSTQINYAAISWHKASDTCIQAWNNAAKAFDLGLFLVKQDHSFVPLSRQSCIRAEKHLQLDIRRTRASKFRSVADIPPIGAFLLYGLKHGDYARNRDRRSKLLTYFSLPKEFCSNIESGAYLEVCANFSESSELSQVDAAFQNTLSVSEKGKHNILIIAAHPDDELLFGADDLLSQSCKVVCLTNGSNAKRRAEFAKLHAVLGHSATILDFPDSKRSKSWNVDDAASAIVKFCEGYLPDRVVSHGSDGEYDHPDHVRCHIAAASVAKTLQVPFETFAARFRGKVSTMRSRLLHIYKSQKEPIQRAEAWIQNNWQH